MEVVCQPLSSHAYHLIHAQRKSDEVRGVALVTIREFGGPGYVPGIKYRYARWVDANDCHHVLEILDRPEGLAFRIVDSIEVCTCSCGVDHEDLASEVEDYRLAAWTEYNGKLTLVRFWQRSRDMA